MKMSSHQAQGGEGKWCPVVDAVLSRCLLGGNFLARGGRPPICLLASCSVMSRGI
jgi:hypothetical protein